MKYLLLAISLYLMQLPTWATEIDYKLEFGLVLHNEYGEPIGFKETTTIPINTQGKDSLYGVIISKNSTENFTVGSIHILPEEIDIEKIMGKTMQINGKGAIFMKTQGSDKPGTYEMEVYINGLLYKTIQYQLLSST
ncbi:hypothetical protein KO495_09950 [Colwellia sp. D2M02]|uniref:hypothetical protein n=1 Tax=Colwellia sp. D2M02 TaxID=2841562 RepID=UPI001C080FFA|nr:hypothetical protein [Colwellia sp. D2M02]MBU2893641.1 hypothetical protein [Colwellia sp. D2M02]